MTYNLFIDISKVAHGSINAFLALAFMYQAWMGLTIRRARKKGEPRSITIRRHRRLGPLLVVLGVAGYCFGLVLVYVDKRRLLEYPFHLAVGSLIVLFILGQYAVSKKLKGRKPSWRTPHLVTGTGIVCLYVLQTVIGLGVLL
jgi:hypothetical protein